MLHQEGDTNGVVLNPLRVIECARSGVYLVKGLLLPNGLHVNQTHINRSLVERFGLLSRIVLGSQRAFDIVAGRDNRVLSLPDSLHVLENGRQTAAIHCSNK